MANFYNSTEGTWIIKGDFNNSALLNGTAAYIFAESGSGTVVYAYDTNAGYVYANEVLVWQTDSPNDYAINGEGIILSQDGLSEIAHVLYSLRKYSDAEAKQKAIGAVSIVPIPSTFSWDASTTSPDAA